jgi:hypothetical protein
MGLAGTYIQVSKGGVSKAIVPYSDTFGFTCTQKYFTPIEELFNSVKSVIQETLETTGGSGGDIASGAIEIVNQGLRLFGVKLFSKAYMAKAWEGEEPIDLGVNLKFFYGMKEEWSGLTEVYKPIMGLMSATVPVEETKNIDIISAPSPSAISVYASYAKSLFSFMRVESLQSKINTIPSAASKDMKDVIPTFPTDDEATARAKVLEKTWKISIGYSKNGTTIDRPFYSLSNLIVTSAGFSFSPELDSNGAPINGSIKLNFSAQTLIVSNDFDSTLTTPEPTVEVSPVSTASGGAH